jgi:SAM-dependent methyltransferase
MSSGASHDASKLKESVREHWNEEPCSTRGLDPSDRKRFFADLETERYRLEPHILDFARFERGRGKRVLEIGVGAATDFVNWARSGAQLSGVDLTPAAIELARERLALEGLEADLRVADAENLPFPDATFDVVYSHGVLHHTPDTEKSIAEVHRVLEPGGTALLMLYNVTSWTAWLAWGAHCLAKGRPWKSPRWAVYHFVESAGTKAYTEAETRALMKDFDVDRMYTALIGADLMQMRPSKRYQSPLALAAFRLYPRWLIRAIGPRFGFARLIEARARK